MARGPAAEGGKDTDHSLPGQLPAGLAAWRTVGEPAEVAPQRLGAVAVPVEEPSRYRTEAALE